MSRNFVWPWSAKSQAQRPSPTSDSRNTTNIATCPSCSINLDRENLSSDPLCQCKERSIEERPSTQGLIRDIANATLDEDEDGQETDHLLPASPLPESLAPFLPLFLGVHSRNHSSCGSECHHHHGLPQTEREEKGGRDQSFQSRIMTNRHPRFLHLFNILASCLILLFCVAVGNLCKTMLSEDKRGITMAMTMTVT